MTLFRNRRRDFSQQSPRTPVIPGVLSVIDTPSIDLTFNASTQTLQADLTTILTGGTFGSSTQIPVLSVDPQGRITSISQVPVSGGGGSVLLQTNGTSNPVQTLLNLVAGTNMTITDDGLGNITFDATGGGGGVTSVNSGININVDNTDPLNPIINSLSDRYKTTSTTSNSVSNGTKTFTVDFNLSYIPLQEVLVVHNPANHMHGEVISYSGTTLVVDIKQHTGSGTYTSWTINLDGTPVDALTGSGTANEIAYFTAARVLASLPVSTYPSLTELSYIKGLTSAIQTQINGKQNTLTTTKSVKIITDNVELDGDNASPGNNKVYGTDNLGVKGWKNDPSSPIPVAAKFYQQDNWSSIGLNSSSVEYVASLNKVYVTNFASNTVTILNATTGEFIGSVAATACIKCKYIAIVNQVYVTSSSSAVIIRIDGATNLPLANISIGVTANGVDILEYSSTKVFITCGNASGSIMVVNPLLGTVASTITASVPTFTYGMALNTNPASLQFDKIVIGAQSGICIFDPSTNSISTTVANPSSAINVARFLEYSSVDDKYYLVSTSNSRLVVLSIATATTFTATFISNQQNLTTVVIDDANDYLFTFPLFSSGSAIISAKMFKKSTLEPIVTINPLTQGGAANTSGLGLIDLSNNRIFMVGRNASTASVSILRYS